MIMFKYSELQGSFVNPKVGSQVDDYSDTENFLLF